MDKFFGRHGLSPTAAGKIDADASYRPRHWSPIGALAKAYGAFGSDRRQSIVGLFRSGLSSPPTSITGLAKNNSLGRVFSYIGGLIGTPKGANFHYFKGGGFHMKVVFALLACTMLISQAHAEGIKRNELKRADLTGKDMDVIVSVIEVPPGESLARHIHPGEEVVYVLEGAMLELPDGKQLQFPTGAAIINARDVPHAGVKVVGDKTLKMLNVHIVDKGKPMTEFVK